MNSTGTILQIAVPADASAINDLVNSVYRGENAKKGWTTEADFIGGIRITPEKVEEIIGRPGNVIFNALVDGKLAGCVHLTKHDNYSLLGMLSVDVNLQGKGIAKTLMTECERYTKEVWGLDEIRMKVIGRRTELIDYYKRRNYIVTGELEEFIIAGDAFGEPTEKLYFEIMSKKL